MKIRLKSLLNKYKNRIVSFIVVFAFVPLFAFDAFAYTFPLNSVTIKPDTGSNVAVIVKNPTWNEINAVYDGGEYSTEFHVNTSFYNVDVLGYMMQGANFTYNYNFDSYDYYIGFNVFFSSFDSSFDGSCMDIVCLNGAGSSYRLALTDYTDSLNAVSYPNHHYKVFSCLAKLPDTAPNSFNWFEVFGQGQLVASNYNEITAYLFEVPKGTDVESVNSLISAINNQTATLGGKIDDTNDFIDKGNSSTSGIVSGNNSAIYNLDEVVSEYHATEQQFFDDFNVNQQAINSDIVGWSWGGLVNCANWVGSTMTDYYNNMGDFRQYIIYPLMLGIVLFFLGRGGSIIGHLFRKPTETTVNTKSVFRREGNTRYTTTTTSRQGGVFRR